jgi:hypothetical protein
MLKNKVFCISCSHSYVIGELLVDRKDLGTSLILPHLHVIPAVASGHSQIIDRDQSLEEVVDTPDSSDSSDSESLKRRKKKRPKQHSQRKGTLFYFPYILLGNKLPRVKPEPGLHDIAPPSATTRSGRRTTSVPASLLLKFGRVIE